MRKAWNEFWSDYADLMRHNNQWLKKHWKGWLLLVIISSAIELLWLSREYVADWFEDLKSKFTRKEKES